MTRPSLDAPDCGCGWRPYALQLEEKIDALTARVEALTRHVFGKKSEKMPPMDREVRRGKKADPEKTREKRKETARAKEKLVTEHVTAKVPEVERCCPACDRRDLRTVGDGKTTTTYDYVPGYFRRRITTRETLACRCGEYIVTAPSPDKATDKTQYGPSFVAHLIVQKCADSIPFYRLEKQYDRIGIPMARSTMTDLFHRHAVLLEPLVQRLLEKIASSFVVLADETKIRMLGSKKKAYLWTFLAGNDIAYVFSKDRSGDTPTELLGGTTGVLVVDAHTGYNAVTTPGGRLRAGCMAHARRKFFDALSGHAEAQIALDLIRELYVVEHEAKEKGIACTDEHLALRREKSRPLLAKLLRWARTQRGKHLPKGKMARAMGYLLKNRRALTRFTTDARIPPDNNRSESALRVVALGRKNFLHVGNEAAGDNLAGLYSLVSTCIAHGKNPLTYLTDVMTRISSHPQSRIDELLPDQWQPPPD